MSHLALKPEALAIASNLLRGSLRYVSLDKGILVSLTGNFCGYPKAPSTPLLVAGSCCLSSLTSLTCARPIGLLVHLTRVNQHHVIPPASYGGQHLAPNPISRHHYVGGSRGKGCQPSYSIRSSSFRTYSLSQRGSESSHPTQYIL